MSNVERVNVGCAFFDSERPPLIPEGVYEVGLIDYRTGTLFGRAPKLIMRFRIMTFGDYFDTELIRYYNIQKFVGKPGKYGQFKVGWNSAFVREYGALFPIPRRLDRIPMTSFEKVFIEAKVKTVSRNSERKKIPKSLHYSVISELLRIKEL